MATSTYTIQIDDDLRKKGEMIFNRFDLDLDEAINLFVKKSVEADNIPFMIEEDIDLDAPYTEEEEALCYSPSNVAAVLEGVKSLDAGKGIKITTNDLLARLN